ncbi:hypothetical protein SAMN04487898_103251 [Pedobacter sp. ok626]|uniref:hypothetical protein n=1 Tax=Pedobacter sp. ok626 TaxID=1761882 RepID=UPI000881656F|nr:hypothetical protein [Pedobacter sp. ok626]SDJ55825.1 hypothetical protein SAMN04487898_103251 [Pedobacter sp. ok626]
MKSKIIYIVLLSFVIVYTSCSKITEDIQEDIFIKDTVSFEIPVLTDLTSSPAITEIKSTLNLEEQVKKSANNFTIENIKTTKITSLNLILAPIILNPTKDSLGIDPNNNFGNLETLKFGISAGGNTGNIANVIIPQTSKTSNLSLTPSILPEELKPFLINSPNYNVIVKAKKITTTPMKVAIAATYTITLSK